MSLPGTGTAVCTKIPILFQCPLHRNKTKVRFSSFKVRSKYKMESSDPSKRIIVCGAGVIGACTAYFLGKKGAHVTVVEKCEPACAASGKAGGFLALDWCDGGPLSALARRSFVLHAELDAELGGAANYGYRRLDTLSLSLQEGQAGTQAGLVLPAWVDGPASRASHIGTPQTTAQVHPLLFTRTVLAAAAEKYGVTVVKGEVKEVRLSDRKEVCGVALEGGEVVEGDGVVLALGPWSARNAVISGLCRISGLKVHSIVLWPQDPETIGRQALSISYKTAQGKSREHEVYPRPTGEVYICGMSEEVEVPGDPQQIQPRKESITMLQRVARTVSSHLGNAEVKAEQACFLPCSEDGIPVIGKIPDIGGAYVATGHSCWGILNAPATGASMAELIVDGHAKSVDLKPFDPARFRRSSRNVSIS
uniref:FAD dependent oxidoreductase domain-containing protein n=1 Tax=Araucaria cunninghamii TaxID=56994 RepID=A0A0D6QX21_ARACU